MRRCWLPILKALFHTAYLEGAVDGNEPVENSSPSGTCAPVRFAQKLTRCLCGALLFATLAVSGQAQTADQTFEAANKLYEEGKFTEAATQYSSLLNSQRISPELWFNQGNAYFKAGQVGRAIACYRAAARLAPRDPDVRANLRFARDQVRAPKWQPSRWSETLGHLSLNEWSMLTLVPVWSFFLLLGAGELRRALRAAIRPWLYLTGAIAVLSATGLAAVWFSVYAPRVVSVVVKEATIRHGPLDESQSAFTVQDGAELIVTDAKGDWLQVSTDEQHSGWINKKQVE